MAYIPAVTPAPHYPDAYNAYQRQSAASTGNLVQWTGSGYTQSPYTQTAPIPNPPNNVGTSSAGTINYSNLGLSAPTQAQNGSQAGIPQNNSGVLDFSQIRPAESWSQSGSRLNPAMTEILMKYLGTGQGNMPSMVDQWTNEAVAGNQITGDQMVQALNQVNNVRASQGILGGTEAQNLRSDVLAKMAHQNQEENMKAYLAAMGIKADLLPKLFGLGSQSQSSSYSYNPENFRIIAGLLQQGFTG